ncbi:MAG: bifunctional DNA-binding transcriptional regulator/O6-methylguanine-DNA methyltransferase Ada [Gammaproteobacteria bacterium]|nr:bifunctional DNA-binding transcriptional regulator/O6-methylguanine-DNA methyltransferase Ada [Gammaproteobacteria bacterium]
MKPFTTDATRWDAVKTRAATADNHFWYSVQTTGVYCRPSCAARRPLRENVAFYDTRDAARKAGFRPCKRCRPDDEHADARHRKLVEAACRKIGSACQTPKLEDLAREAGLSPQYFHRVFKRIVGVTPHQYAVAKRTERFAAEIRTSERVTDAIYNAGFGANSRFYETAGSRIGMTASALKRGGHDTHIRFEIADSWLGAVLIAATEHGVCAILFGDTEDHLLDDLQTRFPNATFEASEQGSDFARWVRAALAHIEAPAGFSDLPLDVGGTAFQERVWQALRAIPAGTTSSYKDIAERIGQPKATRAVAQACAANPAAIVIPCHRVVRADGGLSGYRWGEARKRKLLAREAAI